MACEFAAFVSSDCTFAGAAAISREAFRLECGKAFSTGSTLMPYLSVVISRDRGPAATLKWFD